MVHDGRIEAELGLEGGGAVTGRWSQSCRAGSKWRDGASMAASNSSIGICKSGYTVSVRAHRILSSCRMVRTRGRVQAGIFPTLAKEHIVQSMKCNHPCFGDGEGARNTERWPKLPADGGATRQLCRCLDVLAAGSSTLTRPTDTSWRHLSNRRDNDECLWRGRGSHTKAQG
jgi:hypothetical protein